MTRPLHDVRGAREIFVLTSSATGGLIWRDLPIERVTKRSVIIATPFGEVHLSRRDLERYGQVFTGGELFSIEAGRARDGPVCPCHQYGANTLETP